MLEKVENTPYKEGRGVAENSTVLYVVRLFCGKKGKCGEASGSNAMNFQEYPNENSEFLY